MRAARFAAQSRIGEAVSRNPSQSTLADGELLSLRWQSASLADALDAIDDAAADAADAPEAWEMLRCAITRDPKRGQRLSVQLTLISRAAVHRLRAARRGQPID